MKADYLVGGFRISIGAESNTPGPRTHIVNFVHALRDADVEVDVTLASDLPFMGRFAKVRQSDYAGSSEARVRLADVVRVAAAFWSGSCVSIRSALSRRPDFIYERVAVLQSLTSFHRYKRSAIRVVEANGVLSRETAQDRKVLKAERLAAWIERRVLRKADLVVAVSNPLAAELEKFAGIDRRRVLVLPNGVSRALTEIDRNETGHEDIVVGFVGSVVRWQNLDSFIEETMAARASLSGTGRTVRVEIIGDGAELSRLQQTVQSNSWDEHVHFHGRQNHADAIDIMRRWNVGFAGHTRSSSNEMYHSPLKLYEYAALGLSIVCTPSDDAKSLSASGAFVAMFRSPAEFTDALQRAVEDAAEATPIVIDERRARVRGDHSWDARAALFLDRLDDVRRDRLNRDNR